ncbi:ABC transporter permease [Anaerocolumna sp. MB42-C2]|uniref:ABC transporter permease n=1 Tax=Anaerocolumna sp. MB42-C2 TaxID=3070997 RepID=UPI0027E05166|nr:ABC transporter permease [Anaerocolumna sp. MB42-C2]WMJ89917.1 ABC transporter permease [Anaerocolumna sp. MB42-C2]
MGIFWTLFKSNLSKRVRDGFAVGYNIIFPFILIIILGALLKGSYNKIITSYQYYTLVTVPFCILYSIITAAYAGKDEACSNTAARILAAPVKKIEIVLSKLLSCVVVFALCNIIVLLSCSLILRVPIWGKLIPVIILLTAETFFSCGLGLLIGFGMKNFVVVKNIINIPICLFAIMGGSFYPVGSLNRGWQAVFYLSPLTWINKSIFRYLYDVKQRDTVHSMFIITAVFLVLGLIISAAAIIWFKKEEYLNGYLPGYQK